MHGGKKGRVHVERGLELGQLQEDELMLAQPMSQSSGQRAGLNGVRCRVHGIVRRLGIRTDPCGPNETPSGTMNQQGAWALVCGLVQVAEPLSKRDGKEVGKNPCNAGPYQADGTWARGKDTSRWYRWLPTWSQAEKNKRGVRRGWGKRE